MTSQKSKCVRWILISSTSIILLITGCGKSVHGMKSFSKISHNVEYIIMKVIRTIDEERLEQEEDERILENVKKPLEKFGAFLKELVEDGRQEEMDNYIVSRYLNNKEIENMAASCPAFSHFEEYANYQFDCTAAMVIEADVNEDGYNDIIEYRQEVDSRDYLQNSMTIYKGDAHNNYEVIYYQPHFIAYLSYHGRIHLVRFEGETFLILKDPDSDKSMMTVLYLKEEAVEGILYIESEWEEVEGSIITCQPKYHQMAELICENSMEYSIRSSFHSIGNAEERIEDGDEIYASSPEYIGMVKACKDEERKKEIIYEEKNKDILKGLGLLNQSIAESGRGYVSDIDNDGINELYFKEEALLSLKLSTDRGYLPFQTGELYGDYEGKFGLRYYIYKENQSIDFLRLCGLDIYHLDMVPKIFWIDRQEEENITLIRMEDNYGYENQVRGYLIKDGEYKQVFTIQMFPQIQCSLTYEWRDEAEDNHLSYTVHMRRNGSIWHTEIYGLPNEELQEEINLNMEKLLKQETDQFFLEELTKTVWDGTVKYAVRHASMEKIAITYTILYRYKGLERGYGKMVSIEADLLTGDCIVVDQKTENNYKISKDNGYYSW